MDERDGQLDEQLRAAFSPPAPAHFERMARDVTRPTRPLWPWIVGLAAALLVVAMWLGRPPRGPEGHDAEQLGALWVAAYEQAVDSGFGGAGCCDPGSDLAAMCERFCGERLALGDDGRSELLGCYCGGPTGGCLGVMLRVDGEPVCVFVVPREHDPRPALPDDRGLQLTRRELGPLVLYALSPEPRGDALDEFSLL